MTRTALFHANEIAIAKIKSEADMSNYAYNYQNHYHCPNDGTSWDDEWECMCNDRCPKCRAEIEPYMSIELRSGEEIIHAQAVYDKAIDADIAASDKLHREFDELDDKKP